MNARVLARLSLSLAPVAGLCAAAALAQAAPSAAVAESAPGAESAAPSPDAALAARFAWRAYPNATLPGRAGRVVVAPSAEWLLVSIGAGFDAARLSAELPALEKGAALAEHRGIVRGRHILRVTGLDVDGLRRLATALVSRGLVADAWPALTRATGVGFTDDHLDFKADLPLGGLTEALAKAGVVEVAPTRLPGVFTGRAVDGDAIRASFALAELPEIRWAEPDLIRDVEPLELPNDPQLGEQWHLENPDGRGDINAEAAWAITTGTPETRVAIFDTGVDLDHPDLVDNIFGGFDAADGDAIPEAGCGSSEDGLGPSASCPQQQPFRESHGTSVSGLVAARGNNGINGAGVCPDCTLYPVRIIADQSGFRSLTTAEAFQRAGEDNVAAINNSWGPNLTRYFPLSAAERQALDFVTLEARGGLGIPVLFAAGNDFFTPATANPYASYEGTITVSASTQKDDFACYSDYGDVISIAAPSQGCFDGEGGIATTDYVGPDGYSGGDFTNVFGGTSAACPVATGTVGLILSINPGLTAQQVKLILQVSAAKIRADKDPWMQQFGIDLATEFEYDDHGFSKGFGYGRIDAAAAVSLAQMMPPLTGAACDAACPRCVDNRCAPDCASDADCPGAARCVDVGDGALGCALPRPAVTAPGQPCRADCDACIATVDSQFEGVSVCTSACPNGDEDCPFGFDCRRPSEGADPICIPGNQECGAAWDSVRCQSQVQVSGGGQDFCSCECIPGDPGACPEGFVCSDVQCQQGRNAITCVASSPREANYLPMCVPDPNFRRPCTTHAQCGGAMFCIDGTCSPDRGPGGCDLCTSCTADADCSEGESCVNVPSRGNHCLRHCAGPDSCPANTACTNLPGPEGDFCVNDTFNTKGICPSAWRCEVPDRCFSDADCRGESCLDNVCGGASPPDAAVVDAAVPDAAPPVEVDAAPDATPDAAPSETPDAAAPEADAGGSESPKKGGGGCQTAPVGAPGLPLGALAGLAAGLALRLRRRRAA